MPKKAKRLGFQLRASLPGKSIARRGVSQVQPGSSGSAEVGFAEIVEVTEAVDHGAVTGDFCVGHSVIRESLENSFKI